MEEGRVDPAKGNADERSRDIALLLIAIFLLVIYFLKEFYIPRGLTLIPIASPAPQTVFEVEDSTGVSKVYVYPEKKGEVKSGSKIVINKDGSTHEALMSGEKHLIFSIPIDINKAAAGDFEALPDIGPKLAERIIETREKLGGFKTVDDLKKVKGIGDKKLDKIRDKVTVDN